MTQKDISGLGCQAYQLTRGWNALPLLKWAEMEASMFLSSQVVPRAMLFPFLTESNCLAFIVAEGAALKIGLHQ